jgi:hypothetical protein
VTSAPDGPGPPPFAHHDDVDERRKLWWPLGIASGVIVALFVVGRVFFSPIATLNAPEPAVSADLEVVLDDLAPSVVTAPIVFDLTEAIALLDSLVPVTFGDLDTRLRFAGRPRVSAAFSAQRTPFRVVVDDGDLVLETIVTYEGRGWYKPPLLPELSAGCGSGDAPKPRVRVRIRSVPDVRRDWRLATRTRITMAPVSFEPRDECRVTTFRIDVTEKLVEGVQGFLGGKLRELDQRIGRTDLPSTMTRIWAQLSRQIRLTDELYLQIRPESARLVDLSGAADSLVALVQLQARPRIISAARLRAEDTTVAVTLPPLERGQRSETGLHALVEGDFDYADASELLRRLLKGRRIDVGGRRALIRTVELRGIGGGRVALGVTFGGAIRGRVFLIGTPTLDTAARVIAVRDLDFDVGSADLLTASADALVGASVRDFLRERAVIPDSVALAAVKRLAERGMNRELAPGVDLRAALTEVRGLEVIATTQHLILRASATGEATLRIDRALPLPAPPSGRQ